MECAHRLSDLPSQPYQVFRRKLNSGIVLRLPSWRPTLIGFPSVCAFSGRWQVAQLRFRSIDNSELTKALLESDRNWIAGHSIAWVRISLHGPRPVRQN